ncbi:hypothetical protein Pelo_11206 [Pelomyxa schiedti]|nr:hypothetical protein Pelo_11206 [Pelomyxa schiedti]
MQSSTTSKATGRCVVIEAGVFKKLPIPQKLGVDYQRQSNFQPSSFCYALVERKGDRGCDVKEHKIEYDSATLLNNELRVEIPDHPRAALIQYWYKYPVLLEGLLEIQSKFINTETHYCRFDDPSGKLVHLPVSWCYVNPPLPQNEQTCRVSIEQTSAPRFSLVNSKIESIIYGFVPEAECSGDMQNLAWRDVNGNFCMEGLLVPHLSGGKRVQGFMIDLWVHVPLGSRCIFRIIYRSGTSSQLLESPSFLTAPSS